MSSGDSPRFQFIGGTLVLDFVNTCGDWGMPENRRDYFSNWDDFVRWGELCPWLSEQKREVSALARQDSYLHRVRDVRDRLYELLSRLSRRERPARASSEWLSRTIRKYQANRSLQWRGSHVGWYWNDRASAVDRILGAVIDDAVKLITSDRAEQVSHCNDGECGWLFLDPTASRRRKWCSMADCGNRNKARRHYQKVRK
jgi:predicted RNA-binding Zn ribbon-like protein